MKARVVAGLVVLTLLAACSSSSSKGSEKPPASTDARVAWTRPDLTPLAKPAVAKGTVVVLTRAGRRLFLVGLDEKDGSTRWRHEATPSGVLQGVSLYTPVIGDDVYVLEPYHGRAQWARLLRLDAVSGKVLWSSEPAVFDSQPEPCHDGKDVCVEEARTADGPQSVFRYASASGRRTSEPGTPPGARSLGVGLFDLGGRDPEMLGYAENGSLRWQKPLADLFGPGFSSDGGWDFLRYENPDAFIGSVGEEYVEPQPDTVDLAHSATVGIRASDGGLLWRDDGSYFACFSSIRIPRDPSAPAFPEPEVWPVRCRASGIVHVPADENSEPTVDGLNVAIEGFDPATGHTTWSFGDGPARKLIGLDDFSVRVASDSSIVIPTGGGDVVIDLGTGERRPVSAGELLWCVDDVSFDYREPFYYDDNKPEYEREGGSVNRPCGPGAQHTDTRWTVPRVIGTPAGDVVVVAQPKAVVAYRA